MMPYDNAAPHCGALLAHNELFAVSESLMGTDRRLYLRLADGRGWVADDSLLVPGDPCVVRGHWAPNPNERNFMPAGRSPPGALHPPPFCSTGQGMATPVNLSGALHPGMVNPQSCMGHASASSYAVHGSTTPYFCAETYAVPVSPAAAPAPNAATRPPRHGHLGAQAPAALKVGVVPPEGCSQDKDPDSPPAEGEGTSQRWMRGKRGGAKKHRPRIDQQTT